ncbi:hypothetical protein VTJ83DRAFT_2953 [Remersonia thermophila]|uniref:Nucleoporin n=1 Tax=Remersonia thermophila TaxID=72144 RepID=A0ABR4DCT9_9PEZI
MSGVPPIGAFPQTPVTARQRSAVRGRSRTPPPPKRATPAPLPVAPQQRPGPRASSTPVIPLNILDAPTQRLYALGVYAALFAWKFYDWAQLVEEETESFWLFLKWLGIDFVFLFGLPELRIPWLELSQMFVVVAFFFHVAFDWMLMFNIGFPWQAWLFGFVRVFYDREVAISEHNVKISSIIHNTSLIMGRQIINILPEGSAVLNPEHQSFCLGGDQKTAALPLFFNATIPVEVELIRTDLETNQNESIKLSRAQLRDIERKAKRESQDGDQPAVQYDYVVKKPGVYQLGRVLDEYKLEVNRKTPPTFVVPCPKAWVGPVAQPGRCLGDLSDVSLHVEGTPPLKIKYSRTINGKDHSFHFQSLQPDGFSSPLAGLRSTSLLGPGDDDFSWARPHRVPVSLNESMHVSGEWQYSVDEVQDAFGNVVKYEAGVDDVEAKPRPKHLVQSFVVKERPHVRLEGCDLRRPLKVAKGESKELPVRFQIAGAGPEGTAHILTWLFSPIDTLTESGDHGDVLSIGTYNAKNARDRPQISAPGLYTLRSVAAGSCEGEIQEPSSCLLLNPLEPRLTLRAEEIPDTCAGNSIGLRVDMDLIGTPPFVVRYDVISNGQRRSERVTIPGLRYQMDLIPRTAGHHKYVFTHIGDDIYSKGQKLAGPEYVLEQDVKPAASALIQHSTGKMGSCLGDEVAADVLLLGEPPFTLEWEIIHDGRRKQHKAANIHENSFQIRTNPLTQGGEYTLGLTSVQDRRGCRNFLQDELKISVRRQSPRAAFGQVEGKRKMLAVEGSAVRLPVRLTGEGPWKVFYTSSEVLDAEGKPKVAEATVKHDNGYLTVKGRGTYTLTDVWDNQCHGVVDAKAATFEVDWFARPRMSVVLSPGLVTEDEAGGYKVEGVCEGDVSGFEVALQGTPPYTVEYEVRHRPLQGSPSLSKKKFEASLGKEAIQADTSKAGLYTYKFTSLEDHLYSSRSSSNNNGGGGGGGGFQPLVVKQHVNRRPSASFAKPGQTFKYCKSEQDNEDGIPITLTGVAPFVLEIEIKHQSAAVPEIYRTPPISSRTYDLRIPRLHLRLGTQQIRIRDVRDASGCHSAASADLGGASSVQVQLFEAPTIYPLETRTDYCVGERISYTLSGTAPFEVWYTFDGVERRAKSPTTSFRRVAESPGEFIITTISDKASECRAPVRIAKTIHPLPAVRVSQGKSVKVDIHEGGEVDILFEFFGTPPFEFTYTRSTNARKGQKSQVLETRHEISHEHTKVIRAGLEGTYEVVAIKDKYCAFSTQGADVGKEKAKGQKAIKY